jgi:hypothetical protein
VVQACIQSKSQFRPHIPQVLDPRSSPAAMIRLATHRRGTTSSSMLTITCSVTLTQRSKTDLSAVVKHKLGAFVQHRPPQPHRPHIQSNQNFNKQMQLLTVIRPPHQFRVARRCSPSACRTDYPCQLLHQRRLRNLALHAIQAVQPTRHQPP